MIVNADSFTAALRTAVSDPDIRAWPLFGSVSQASDSTDILCSPAACRSAGRLLATSPGHERDGDDPEGGQSFF
jgi:hypothetical protein